MTAENEVLGPTSPVADKVPHPVPDGDEIYNRFGHQHEEDDIHDSLFNYLAWIALSHR